MCNIYPGGNLAILLAGDFFGGSSYCQKQKSWLSKYVSEIEIKQFIRA